MSNHSGKFDPEIAAMFGEVAKQSEVQRLEDVLAKQRDAFNGMGLPLGETNRFPRGQITKQDEGELIKHAEEVEAKQTMERKKPR